MADPFLAQITIFAGNFAPRGWAFCDGQLLPIAQYTAVFSLIGTTFGGDGRTTFGLPDLRGRVPIHPGSGPGLSTYRWGQKGGQETEVLTVAQLPSHSHNTQGKNGPGDETNPGPNTFVATATNDLYAEAAGVVMGATTNTGNNQGHPNIQPYLSIYYIIALQGTFPSRS